MESDGGNNAPLNGASFFTLNQWFTTLAEDPGEIFKITQARAYLRPINHHLRIFLKSHC